MRLLLCVCLVGLLAAETRLDNGELEGHPFTLVDGGAAVPKRALLVWLAHRSSGPKSAATWWRRSGLAEAGVTILCPAPAGHRWERLRDRPRLLHLIDGARTRLELQADQVVIGGAGDGAGLALRLQLLLPDRFAGCVLARGMLADPWPEIPPGGGGVIGLFGNINDPYVPLKVLRRRLGRLDAERFPSVVVSGSRRDQLGPEVWGLARTIIIRAGVVLPDP